MTFFTEGTYRVAALSLRMLTAPNYEASLDDQALLGESVEVLATGSEFSQIRVPFSGKTGWVLNAPQKLISVGENEHPETHRVAIPRAVTFRRPDAETENMVILPLNALIAVGDHTHCGRDEFVRVLGLQGGIEAWVRASALMPIGTYDPDFVAVQERCENIPYIWGVRDTTLALDCSRLLGESLRAAGQDYCPGDTVEQVKSSWLGELIYNLPDQLELERGDMVFWKGHVATMVDRTRCIHATDLAPYHKVVTQELSTVIRERVEAGKGQITAVRRFPNYRRSQLKSLVA